LNGKGPQCPRCAASASEKRRVAEKVRDRLSGADAQAEFLCPCCRRGLSWETMKSSEIEATIYVREKIYYCPHCRSFLGVSSWHTEG
jgi:hypothetical protein